MGSELYSLVLRCATIRSELTDINYPILPHLNILITIIEKYFGQILYVDSIPEED